jgi:hypothetical protein
MICCIKKVKRMSHTVHKCLFSTESTSKQKSDFHKENMEKTPHIGIYTPVSTITDIANQADLEYELKGYVLALVIQRL